MSSKLQEPLVSNATTSLVFSQAALVSSFFAKKSEKLTKKDEEAVDSPVQDLLKSEFAASSDAKPSEGDISG